MLASLAEVIHRIDPAIDVVGAVGFLIVAVFLLGSRTVLLRGCGWLFAGMAGVYLLRFGLAVFDRMTLYSMGIWDLSRLVIVLMVWVFVVRHVIWFPGDDR